MSINLKCTNVTFHSQKSARDHKWNTIHPKITRPLFTKSEVHFTLVRDDRRATSTKGANVDAIAFQTILPTVEQLQVGVNLCQ